MQEYIKPMLPAELSRPFDNEEWIFEKNPGGFRAIVVKSNENIRIYANRYQLFNCDFPQLVNEFDLIPFNFVLDGEIVMLNELGKPDAHRLKDFKANLHLSVNYYAFDLLSVTGQSFLRTPLLRRKEMLKKLLPKNSKLIHNKSFVMGFGCDLYHEATKEKLEGITAKKIDSIYRPGKITSEWLQIKVRNSQEVFESGFVSSFALNREEIRK